LRDGRRRESIGRQWAVRDGRQQAIDAGTAHIRRASVYIDGRGQQLGPPKTERARGEHWLMPSVVALLARREQEQERAAAPAWVETTYKGEPVSLVFTNPSGGLVLRQTVAKVIKSAAKTAGINAEPGTHAGRRTVVTTLFVDGDEALEDIARFVGHARPSTTAGYVKRLGHRPQSVAKRAANVLDGLGLDVNDNGDAEGSESPVDLGSNAGSYGPESSGPAPNHGGR
jgi:integrase